MGFVGLSFASLAIPVVVLAVFVLFYSWLKALIARSFGAERGKKRWVILSLCVGILLQVLILAVVKFLFYTDVGTGPLSAERIYQDGGIALVATFVIFLLSVLIFSQCVKLGYFKSLVATVVFYIPAFFVVGGLGVLSAFFLAKQQGIDMSEMMSMASMSAQGVSDEDLILAAEEVCACGDDQDMLMNKLMAFSFISASYQSSNTDPKSVKRLESLSAKVSTCAEGGPVMLATADMTEKHVEHDIESDNSTDAEAEIEEIEDQTPRYREFKLADVKMYIGAKVRVYRNAADPMVGKLVSFANGDLKVQQRRYGGNVTFPISTKDIESLEVYY